MKYSIATLCLFVLLQLIVTIEVQGQDLNISMCSGGIETLTIPDCDDDEDCCIVWYDNDLPEGQNEVGHSCSLNVIYPTENKSYRIVITKDNFAEKTELTATVTIINPEDINVSIKPLHKCYTKGAPIPIEDFEISSTVAGLDVQLGGGVFPGTAPFFDEEVATSIHEVLYHIPSCSGFEGLTKPVELSIVNPDKRTSNFNPSLLADPVGIIDKINTGLKFLKFGFCSPYVGASKEYEIQQFNLCCKNENPEGKIIAGDSHRVGLNGEVGVRCGGEDKIVIPFIATINYGGYIGAGVELSLARTIESTCNVDNGRRCYGVGLTPKFFGEAFAELAPSYPGSNAIGLDVSLTGSFSMPLAKYCSPEDKWMVDDGPVCLKANLQVNVTTNSFYIKAVNITLAESKSCSQ